MWSKKGRVISTGGLLREFEFTLVKTKCKISLKPHLKHGHLIKVCLRSFFSVLGLKKRAQSQLAPVFAFMLRIKINELHYLKCQTKSCLSAAKTDEPYDVYHP